MSVFIVYIRPRARCLKDRERNAYHEGRKLIAQLWQGCRKMLYRLLTHTNRCLHNASCSASAAFKDSKVNYLSFSSVSLSVLLPNSLYQPPAVQSPPTHDNCHLSLSCHYILPLTLLYLNNCYHSLDILPS